MNAVCRSADACSVSSSSPNCTPKICRPAGQCTAEKSCSAQEITDSALHTDESAVI